MQQEIVESMQQLLKGTNMGLDLFSKLQAKLTSETLIQEFDEMLFAFKAHQQALKGMLVLYEGEDFNDGGMLGMMVSIMKQVKNMMLDSDLEVLQEAIKQIDSAKLALHKFKQEHQINDEHFKELLNLMCEDYDEIYHRLKKYEILFSK